MPELVDFLHEVARRRADPAEMPGLEAMMPEQPGRRLAQRRAEPIPGDLRVVAGDLEGDSIGSWVKTLLADAFYWTDNDLVVQTRSMYGGAPRARTPSGAARRFLLDQRRQGHALQLLRQRAHGRRRSSSALLDDAPAGFAAIGPLSWAGEDASGTRAALRGRALARRRRAAAPARSARRCSCCPGILGSNLKLDGKRIWLGFRFVNGLKALAWDPATAAGVEPDGPIGSVYDDLIERLADSHEVIPFAFDWRRPIEDEARRLGRRGRRRARGARPAASSRCASSPTRWAAWSRARCSSRSPTTWQRMMARDGARLLMLGTPNARLVGADADAVGRRHLRQRAGRVRLAVRQRRRARS